MTVPAHYSLPSPPLYSSRPEVAAIELIDGAYDIVELWQTSGRAQEMWKREWLAKARELGAQPSP